MNLENYSLIGKTALITGGAGMLGVQHAAAILEVGGNIVLTDLKQKNLDQALDALSQSFNKKNIYLHPLDVTDETVCTREPLIGARAIKKGPDDSILPAFCDGETWKTPQQLELSDCKVCIACSDDREWRLVTCDEADDDGWAISNNNVCAKSGNLAIKFVCGPDSSAGRFPVAKYRDKRGKPHGVDDESYPYEYYEDNP